MNRSEKLLKNLSVTENSLDNAPTEVIFDGLIDLRNKLFNDKEESGTIWDYKKILAIRLPKNLSEGLSEGPGELNSMDQVFNTYIVSKDGNTYMCVDAKEYKELVYSQFGDDMVRKTSLSIPNG